MNIMKNLAENEIATVLQEYAQAINTVQTDLIHTFYAKDGLLMPEGVKTLTREQLLFSRSHIFFERKKFKIAYMINHIACDGKYAFVSASAKTSMKDAVSGIAVEKSSRDFFVFRRDADTWKIFRYVFNRTT